MFLVLKLRETVMLSLELHRGGAQPVPNAGLPSVEQLSLNLPGADQTSADRTLCGPTRRENYPAWTMRGPTQPGPRGDLPGTDLQALTFQVQTYPARTYPARTNPDRTQRGPTWCGPTRR